MCQAIWFESTTGFQIILINNGSQADQPKLRILIWRKENNKMCFLANTLNKALVFQPDQV